MKIQLEKGLQNRVRLDIIMEGNYVINSVFFTEEAWASFCQVCDAFKSTENASKVTMDIK